MLPNFLFNAAQSGLVPESLAAYYRRQFLLAHIQSNKKLGNRIKKTFCLVCGSKITRAVEVVKNTAGVLVKAVTCSVCSKVSHYPHIEEAVKAIELVPDNTATKTEPLLATKKSALKKAKKNSLKEALAAASRSQHQPTTFTFKDFQK